MTIAEGLSPKVVRSRSQRPVLLGPSELSLARRQELAKISKVSFLLIVVSISIFIPAELSFFISGFRLTLVRLIFIATSPYLMVLYIRQLVNGTYRFALSDMFVTLFSFWYIFAPSNIDGIAESLHHAGPDVLEFFVGYWAARLLLRSPGEVARFAAILCVIIAAVAAIGALDTVSGSYLTRDIARQISGFTGSDINDWSDSHRMGFLRATGPVEHPILFSFICAVGLIISYSVQLRWKAAASLACILGVLAAFSSASLQAALMGIALLLYNRVTPNIRGRWIFLIGLGSIALALAFAASNSPVGFIVSHLTFDSASGYYRYWTWSRVIFYVSQSPWLGLGFGIRAADINHSIDSLWLVLSIISGYPGAGLMFLTMIGCVSLSTRESASLLPDERRLGTALGIVVFLVIFIAFTVDLWGTAWILTSLLIGMRASLGAFGSRGAFAPGTNRSKSDSAHTTTAALYG